MDVANKRNTFILIIFLIICDYCNGACSSLMSTETTNITCSYNDEILKNCINPIEGTKAMLSCNSFYEETSILENPFRFCRGGTWDDDIPNCYPICGQKGSKESFGQLNEQHDLLLEYPWHVGIYSNNQVLLCLGTLISMNLVLTAAHCVVYQRNYVHYSTDDLLVASGKNYPQYVDKRDEFQQYSEIKEIETPEQFTGAGSLYAFDIAILVLQKPFSLSPFVQPTCLNLITKQSLLEEKALITLGWSYNYESGTLDGVLKEVPVVTAPLHACYGSRFENFNFNFLFDKICGGAENKGTLCHGNSGGGLVLKNKHNGRYYIEAISLIAPRLVENCTLNYFIPYTSIFEHSEFIINQLRINNRKMQSCQLPSLPHSKFVSNNSDKVPNELQSLVPLNSVLTLICNAGYNSELSETKFTCTENGQWTPSLEDCTQQFVDNTTLPSPTTYLTLPNPKIVKSEGINYTYNILIVAVVVLFVVALIAVILLKIKFKKEKELRRELKLAGLDSFQYGDLKRFNPELGIDDQAEFLPYNSNFEFPRDKLELGKQLGSGAFGIVLKADAFGIISKEEKTTVAVKTVKNIIDHVHIKALITELKVMVHLGQHLNVLNLLGACTQNIAKGELLVIVEYCRFGNVYNYLLQNRQYFIDQIDSVTGNIDYSVGSKDSEIVRANSNNPCMSEKSYLQRLSTLSSRKNYVSKNYDNNIQSECKPTLGENFKNTIKPLFTKDLISWSFQIARGMEYLVSRKVLHGDLAARNILLAENNIIKICDFGLAKRMYRNANYKKNKNCPLPFKWMAIESIRDLVFSTQSDIWSYGIVLWELFSLAQTPYPGMEADEKLYRKLLDGYKMESPPYAPKEMYKIMCDCWNIDPLLRPSFNKLAGAVGLMLEENIRQHYIDLNDPYFVINTRRLNEGQTDYLAMLNPPDAIGTPGYLRVEPDYLAIDKEVIVSNNEENSIVDIYDM